MWPAVPRLLRPFCWPLAALAAGALLGWLLFLARAAPPPKIPAHRPAPAPPPAPVPARELIYFPLALPLGITGPQRRTLAALPLTPADAVAAAAADVVPLDAKLARHVRYLSLYHLSPGKPRERAWRLLSYHCNSLSRESDITPPSVVPGTAGALLRINLADYGIDPEVWEQLANVEPFFHIKVKAVETFTEEVQETAAEKQRPAAGFGLATGRGAREKKWIIARRKSGKKKLARTSTKKRVRTHPFHSYVRTKKKPAPPQPRTVTRKRDVIKTALAPWLAESLQQTAALAALVEATRSQVPVVRGDWFFYQTAIQIGGKDANPRYYQFLGLKNLADYKRLAAFDAKQSRRFVQPLIAAIANSGVSIQPRRVERDEKVGGGFWQTKDSKLSVDKNNPLRVLNGGFKFDAQEFFAHLPNGMWATFLADAQGNAQESAPDFVGHDKTSSSNDGRIHVGTVSCFRCHKQDGLQDLKDWSRYLFRPPLALQSPDYDVLLKLRQQYLRDLLPRMTADRLRYATALRQCNGLTGPANARLIRDLWEEWVDTPVDLPQAAAELGTTPDELVSRLGAYLRATGSIDTVIATYLRPRGEQEPVPRDQWNEAFALAQFALRGQVPAEYVSPARDNVLRGTPRRQP